MHSEFWHRDILTAIFMQNMYKAHLFVRIDQLTIFFESSQENFFILFAQ